MNVRRRVPSPVAPRSGTGRAAAGRPGTRRLRRAWGVPVGAAAAVAVGVTASAVFPSIATATAPALAPRTPTQLIAAIAGAGVRPLSGTIRQTSNLGLPALPGVTDSATSPTALLTGSHTARLWIRSPAQQRIAVVGSLTETDFIHDGSSGWVWDSSADTVEHVVLPAGSPDATASGPAMATPAQLATALVRALGTSTTLSVGSPEWVAGRSTYDLVLAPRQAGSLVGRIEIDVDASTSVPLRVRAFARDSTDAAFTTTFTSVTFDTPAASLFAFSPPAGATVTTRTAHRDTARRGSRSAGGASPTTILGSGWTRVVAASDPAALTGALGAADSATGSGASGNSTAGATRPSTRRGSRDGSAGSDTASQLQTLLASAAEVSGSFGHGRLLRTNLLTVLVLSDGRVFAGAVTPAVLEQAAVSEHAAG